MSKSFRWLIEQSLLFSAERTAFGRTTHPPGGHDTVYGEPGIKPDSILLASLALTLLTAHSNKIDFEDR